MWWAKTSTCIWQSLLISLESLGINGPTGRGTKARQQFASHPTSRFSLCSPKKRAQVYYHYHHLSIATRQPKSSLFILIRQFAPALRWLRICYASIDCTLVGVNCITVSLPSAVFVSESCLSSSSSGVCHTSSLWLEQSDWDKWPKPQCCYCQSTRIVPIEKESHLELANSFASLRPPDHGQLKSLSLSLSPHAHTIAIRITYTLTTPLLNLHVIASTY